MRTRPRTRLTRREHDVLAVLCAPMADEAVFLEPASLREIADALGVSDAAIKQHLLHLYDKFDIHEGPQRRTRLANAVVEGGVVAPSTPPPDALAAARNAASLRNWRRAYDVLTTLDPSALDDVDAQLLLGEAAMWSGAHEASIAARERAYGMLEHDPVRAGLVALSLCVNQVVRNNVGESLAWLAKARRHLADLVGGAPIGHLRVTEALFALAVGQFEDGLSAARQAHAIALAESDPDLEALALVAQGYGLTVVGRRGEAAPLIDEAMASATGGELGPFATGIVYCRTLCACLDSLDHDRARQWTDAITRAGVDRCTAGFPGDCRTHRATLSRWAGDWDTAEAEALRACEEARLHDLAHAGIAEYELGVLALRRGDPDSAEAFFHRAHALGCPPLPGLALLTLERGQPAEAMAALQTALDQLPPRAPQRAFLLPALVQAAVAQGELDRADAASRDLAEVAAAHPAPFIAAAHATAAGRVALARRDTDGALARLHEAVQHWLRAEVPFELGCARVLLAEAHQAAGNRLGADLELRAAIDIFDRLGAGPMRARAEAVASR